MKVAIFILMLAIVCMACPSSPQFVIVDSSADDGNTYFIESDGPVTIVYPATGKTVVVEEAKK